MTPSILAAIDDRPGVRRFIPLAVALSLLLTACVPLPGAGEPGPATPTGAGTPSLSVEASTSALVAAQAALAAKRGVPASQIGIVSTERVEWPDACLGAAREGEICAQVITPGYRIVLEANAKEYEAHTDDSGQAVRIVSP
jgi:hypothetical protein